MGPFTGLIKEEQSSILVVNNFKSNLKAMEDVFFKEGLRVYTASGSGDAIETFKQHLPDLAILDVTVPGADGFELCLKLKDISGKRFFPVILLSALADQKSRIKGLESGADDFISKPFDNSELILKIKSLLKVKALQEELDDSESIILTLIVTMEARDPYTKGHSTRVSKLSADFVSFLGINQKNQEEMKKAGILHDIGKICLSASLLCKPGALTEEEADVIKRHVVLGEEICQPLFSMRKILPAIRHHHERWDGKGYPDRLGEKDIPLMARVLFIVDSFDAMVSVRPYRDHKSAHGTLETMNSERDKGQWDPELLGYFLEMMG